MDNEMPEKDMSKMEDKPATPTATPANYSTKSEGGYGKKGSWGKWVLIYIVVAIVVYGVIYYFIKHSGGSGSTGTGY